MSIERELNKRSESKCELCAATENLKVYSFTYKKVELTNYRHAALVLTKSKIQALKI
jgi:hypothetical protein